MKYFITGGAGFIGSHIANYLLSVKETALVKIYDNFSSGTRHNLDFLKENKKLVIVEGEIENHGLLTDEMRGSDLVFHLAANPDISKAVQFPQIDFNEGTVLTNNVIEAVRINKVRKLIFTSGSGVYGENNIDFDESYGPLKPISTYGASKLASEALISSYCYMFGIWARAFRFANVVGGRQTHGVGYDFIKRLINDPSELRILGDGSQVKSYIHVSDILNAVFTTLSNDSNELFDIYNVATLDYITVNQIAEYACNTLNLENVKYQHTGGDRGWNGDVPKIRFNTKKIREKFGWANKLTSEEAIKQSLREIKEDFKGK
jgi:UDP-glucose 4-epimerase